MDVNTVSQSLNARAKAAQDLKQDNNNTQASQTAVQHAAAVSAVAADNTNVTAADGFAENTVAVSKASGTIYTRAEASKGLSAAEVQTLNQQRLDAYSKMIEQLAGNQVYAGSRASGSTMTDALQALFDSTTAPLKDVLSTLQVSDEDVAAAKDAVSENGEWGVNAVATRIVDMAVSLSGGDASKFETLRSAAIAGFDGAAKRWGVDSISQMPSITTDTYNEVIKRFDYLQTNGSMDGYVYGQTKVAEGNS